MSLLSRMRTTEATHYDSDTGAGYAGVMHWSLSYDQHATATGTIVVNPHYSTVRWVGLAIVLATTILTTATLTHHDVNALLAVGAGIVPSLFLLIARAKALRRSITVVALADTPEDDPSIDDEDELRATQIGRTLTQLSLVTEFGDAHHRAAWQAAGTDAAAASEPMLELVRGLAHRVPTGFHRR